jgi:hypothetical protein
MLCGGLVVNTLVIVDAALDELNMEWIRMNGELNRYR